MDLEIVYYEQYDGVLQKVAEMVVQTRNASLDTICREALGEVRATQSKISFITRAVSNSCNYCHRWLGYCNDIDIELRPIKSVILYTTHPRQKHVP